MLLLHASLIAPERSVLIMVDPAARLLEIVTGDKVRKRLPETPTPDFAQPAWDGGPIETPNMALLPDGSVANQRDAAIEHPVICAVDRGLVKGMLAALYGDRTDVAALVRQLVGTALDFTPTVLIMTPVLMPLRYSQGINSSRLLVRLR